MALIFILKCDHFSGMETKQTLVKERTEHVPYAAIIFLDLIHLLAFFYIYDALGRSAKVCLSDVSQPEVIPFL